MKRILNTSGSWGPTVLRLSLAIVFLAHGGQKMFGWFHGPGLSATIQMMHQGMGIPPFLGFLAAFAEFFGGLGLLVGLLSRVAALGILVNMSVATFLVHWHNGLFLSAGPGSRPGFEYAMSLGLMALSVVVTGGGALSLDRALTQPAKAEGLRLETTPAAQAELRKAS